MADTPNYDKEIEDLQSQLKNLTKRFESHIHDGRDSQQVSDLDTIPKIRASGSITMATNGQSYRLGLITNPEQIQFYGIAIHWSGGVVNSGSVDIRAICIGSAELGKSFYFQPDSTNSVMTGGQPQNIIQSSMYFGMTGTGAGNASAVHALVDEGHIVNVQYPSASIADIVARATVTNFDNDHVDVLVGLAAGWEIIGNFVVT